MGAYVRALISWPRVTGLPKDTQTNSLYFRGTGTETALSLAAAMATPVTAFMQEYDGHMGSDLFSSTAHIDWYDLSDPEPRAPIRHDNVTLSLAAGPSLPEEVSIVLSFQGDIVSGTSRASRRGRVYLPTPRQATGAVVGGRFEWNASMLTDTTVMAGDLKAAAHTTTTDWVVFSPKILADTGELNAATTPATNGWVDNSPDTQRRRGHDATVRTLWS